MTRTEISRLPVRLLVVFVAMVSSSVTLFLRADEPLPNVAVSIGLKVVSMQKQFAKPEGLTVYVLGDPNVARAFEAQVNRPIGAVRVSRVFSGEELPTEKPDILFVGDRNKLEAAVVYTRNHKVLSMARNEKFKGVTLIIYSRRDGTSEITMNMSGALLEGIEVNPATLKVAKVAQ